MSDDALCVKRYTLTVVDPGCDCCSYVAVAQYDTLNDLHRDHPNLDGYEIDAECECEEDHV